MSFWKLNFPQLQVPAPVGPKFMLSLPAELTAWPSPPTSQESPAQAQEALLL